MISDMSQCAAHSMGAIGECLPGSTTDLGQSQLDSPDLALVAETILADELQLGIPNPTLTSVPRRKRSKLALSGRGIHTDERPRKDDGGRWRSWSRNGAPFWWLSMVRREKLRVRT